MVTVVQGGQYGSEAKGAVTGYLVTNENYDFCVRTGAVNAGHTVYYKGKPYKMQQLPCGWVRPECQLVIGAGAMVHLDILQREISMVEQALKEPIGDRLHVDYRAGIHSQVHTDRSTQSDRHHLIGATGKGASEAIIDKIRGRGTGYRTFGHMGQSFAHATDTVKILNAASDSGKKILIEGTQGTLLDLNLGGYPYTTHKMTSPANWLAECGLSPMLCDDIVMVVRTYPIRVAGNSGFFPGETSWPALAREINDKLDEHNLPPRVLDSSICAFEEAVKSATARAWELWETGSADKDGFPVPPGSDGLDQHKWDNRYHYRSALSEINRIAINSLSPDIRNDLSLLFEFTTVTNKLRRVARQSEPELDYSGMLNRPSRIVVTFMNYEFPQHWGSCGHSLSSDELKYVSWVAGICGGPVTHVSYGPESQHIFRV